MSRVKHTDGNSGMRWPLRPCVAAQLPGVFFSSLDETVFGRFLSPAQGRGRAPSLGRHWLVEALNESTRKELPRLVSIDRSPARWKVLAAGTRRTREGRTGGCLDAAQGWACV